MKITIKLFIFLFLLFNFYNYCFACGPYFDDAYLVRGSKEQFLSIPEGNFLYELERIAGNKKYQSEENDPYVNSHQADIDDLNKALESMGMLLKERNQLFNFYGDLRKKIYDYLEEHIIDTHYGWYSGEFRRHESAEVMPLKLEGINIPDRIPKEFKLYIKGAIAYHNSEFTEAIKIWEDLLNLSEESRRYKTVWANFMIGKSYLSLRKTKEAIPYFEKTRECALKGFKDSLNLSFDSFGWQALAEYESGQYSSSIKHYLEQLDSKSLSWVCNEISSLDDDLFNNIISDETSRKVIIAWVVSRSPWSYNYRTINEDPNQNIYSKLLNAFEEINEKEIIDSADRIAWIHYNNGNFKSSQKWLSISDKESPITQWIESKLLLRGGNIDQALSKLKELIPLFEKNSELSMFYGSDEEQIKRIIHSEIGLLQLRRKDYISAFDTLIKGEANWEDIAYVAEKVLTTEELEDYLFNNENLLLSKIEWFYPENLSEPTFYNALRYLLARRFVRLEDWDKAIEYMPTEFTREWWRDGRGYETFSPKQKLKELKLFLDNAKNSKLDNEKRAKNYYQAALLMRKYGMELLGTELDPDWFVFNGGYAFDDSIEQRFAIVSAGRKEYYEPSYYQDDLVKMQAYREKVLKIRDFFTGSEDEEKRAVNSLPNPSRRFHYRFKAADLMWESAKLLPDNDELKSKALSIGGSYIKIKDPNGALKFWKELVNSCSKTELGQEAKKFGWFPKNIK